MDENTLPEPSIEDSIRILLAQVPAPIRTFVLNGLQPKTEELMARYSIHVDQGGILERELLLMLLGQEEPANFATELQSAGIPADVVRNLINDINKEVFIPLRQQEEKGGVAPASLPNLENTAPKTEWVQVNAAQPVTASVPTPSVPSTPTPPPASVPAPAPISMPPVAPMQAKPTQSYGLPPVNLPGTFEFHPNVPSALAPVVTPVAPAPMPTAPTPLPAIPTPPPVPAISVTVPPPAPPVIHTQTPPPFVRPPVQQAPVRIGFEAETKPAEPEIRTMATDMKMVKSGEYQPQERAIPSFSTAPADSTAHISPPVSAQAPVRPFPAASMPAPSVIPSAPRSMAASVSPTQPMQPVESQPATPIQPAHASSTPPTRPTNTANENLNALHAVLKEYGVDPYREPLE